MELHVQYNRMIKKVLHMQDFFSIENRIVLC